MTHRIAVSSMVVTVAGALVFASASKSLLAQDPTPAETPTPRTQHRWSKVSVTLPVSTKLFPAGDAAQTANSQCLICHSVEMVLTQPARTEMQWKETINKMRNAYGAPLPAGEVDALSAYLVRVVGHDGQ